MQIEKLQCFVIKRFDSMGSRRVSRGSVTARFCSGTRFGYIDGNSCGVSINCMYVTVQTKEACVDMAMRVHGVFVQRDGEGNMEMWCSATCGGAVC